MTIFLIHIRRCSLWVVFIMLMCSACDGKEQVQEEQEPREYVRIKPAEDTTFMEEIHVSGNIRGWEQALVGGQQGEIINKILVDRGDFVRQGQVLVRMNQSQYNQARAQLELARKDLRRMKNLLEVGSISEQEYDQARTEYINALNSFRQIRENTELTSPLTGVVANKFFVQGETYVPSNEQPAIIEVVDINPAKLIVNLSNRYYNQIEQSDTIAIRLDNIPDTTFTGIVYKKAPTLNEQSRTFEVEVRVPNREYLLRPGMYATAVIGLEEQQGIFVPVSAVIKQPGTTNEYVFVEKDGRASRRLVETGFTAEGQVQIVKGLQEGEKVIVDGAAKLNDGDPVIAKNL